MQSAMADSTSKICLKWHWRAFKMTAYGYTLRGHEQGNGVTMKRDGYWWHNEPGMAGEWYVISHFYISRCSRLVTIILCATVEMCSGLLVFFFYYYSNPTCSHILLNNPTFSHSSFCLYLAANNTFYEGHIHKLL